MPSDFDFSLEVSATASEIVGSDGRVDRLKWVLQQLGDGVFSFQDGEFSKSIFQEAIDCFINGQSIAAIVLAFSFLERSIAGRFFEIGDVKFERSKAETLFREARTKGWLTDPEFELLKSAKDLRNSVTHFRDPLGLSRLEMRAICSSKSQRELLAADARVVLVAAIRILRKTSI